MVRLILLVFVASVISLISLKASQTTDSLVRRLAFVDDRNRVKLLCDLCWEFRFVSADSAFLYGNQALELANEINYPNGKAQSYNDLGIIFIDQGNFTKALDYFDKSMSIRKQLGDTAGIASLYNKIGIIHQKQGNLKLALENQIEALKIYELLQHDLWIGYCLNNIAIVHQNLGNLEKSLEYHLRALDYRKRMNDSYGEGGSLGNIGNVYFKMGDTTAALDYYEQSLDILREIGDDESVSVQLSNMGNIYSARGDNATALRMLLESLQLREKLGDQKGISSALVKLGEVYTNQEKYHQASQSLYQALDIAKKIQVVEEELAAYIALAKMYALQHRLDSAFLYTNYYIAAKDSLYEKRLEQQIVDTQEKYETENRKKEIELLKKENEITEIGLKQRKTEIGLLVFLIIILVGGGSFIFYRRRQMQIAALKEATIRHSEKQLKSVLEGQEDERRRIARELHDGVGQKLSGIKLNWEMVSDSFKSSPKINQLEKMSHMLDDAVAEVRTISHQMMPKELEQFGLLPAIRSILQFSFGNIEVQYNFEEIGMDKRLPQDVELGLFRILQELIGNILKHANANEVSIQLIRRSQQIMMMVEDNGDGFDIDNIKSNGIGLMNIESRVEAINGILNYETENGKGTLVTIRIPLV